MPLHTVCQVDELKPGQMKAFSVAGVNLIIYHLDSGFQDRKSVV